MRRYTPSTKYLLACASLWLACSGLTADEQTQFVTSHNSFRANANPPPLAGSMPDLVWDSQLATVAQNWAVQCIWGHNPSRVYPPAPSDWVGENIYATTVSTVAPSTAVTMWNSENVSFTYSTNTCASGMVCGHYTQVVWAGTTKVGCAIQYCPTGLQGLSWPSGTIVVCDYYLGGNWVGQLPYQCQPPQCGTRVCGTLANGCGSVSCGQCTTGYSCDTNGACQCIPTTCAQLGRQCGQWSDGCSSTLDCGTCQSPNQCQSGSCVCVPATCGIGQCGLVSDGCGNTIDCGSCAPCSPSATCDGKCGVISDGCSGTIDCGSCTSPNQCISNECTCVPQTCTGKCGQIDDGCGHTLDCGGCTSPDECDTTANTCKCTPQACGTRECGVFPDGCYSTIDCGTCDGTCDNGVCTPCVPTPCGQRNCGSFDNGCGVVSCGACTGASFCNTSNICSPLNTQSDWVPFIPDAQADWTLDSYGVLTFSDTSNVEHRVKYVPLAGWASATSTTFTLNVTASEGVVGLGMRLGQGTSRTNDGVYWKLAISAGKATSYLCQYYYGADQTGCNTAVQSGITWKTTWNNVTINFRTSGTKLYADLWVNGAKATNNKSYYFTASTWPQLGGGFVVAKGTAQKKFSQAIVRTATSVHVDLQTCMTDSAFAALAVSLLGCPLSAVAVRAVGEDARCSRTVGLYNSFIVSFSDTASVPASTLASQFTELSNSGAFAYDGVTVTSASEIPAGDIPDAVEVSIEAVPAQPLVPSPVAAAGLSAGAIAGIAVGAAAGVAGVAAVSAAIVAATRRSPKEKKANEEAAVDAAADAGAAPPQHKSRNPVRNTIYKLYKKRGVDVITLTETHQSITARAPGS